MTVLLKRRKPDQYTLEYKNVIKVEVYRSIAGCYCVYLMDENGNCNLYSLSYFDLEIQ